MRHLNSGVLRTMALLAEEIVEEWLNREGYFTIRGIKLGVHEIDFLAVKSKGPNNTECRHLEVQASMRPVSYISHVPKQLQRAGRSANSAKRTPQELREGVEELVWKKFEMPAKLALMQSLWGGTWTRELVVNVVKSEEEVTLIQSHGVSVIRLKDILSSLKRSGSIIQRACGADFIDLIQFEGPA